MKSADYVHEVVSVYREVLDSGMPATEAHRARLAEAFSRGFTTAYLQGNRGNEIMSYGRPNNRGVFVGRVARTEEGLAYVTAEVPLNAGDIVEFWTNKGHFAATVPELGKADQGSVRIPVDHKPELLAEGIANSFGGDAQAFIRAYFATEREMATTCDFDIIGHPDIIRKFNGVLRYFDESADWYNEELRLTADAFAASGKIVEVNTGGISRGWIDDAYPSPAFRALLRERGVRFILSSDAHSAAAIDCAFDRFAAAETYVDAPT